MYRQNDVDLKEFKGKKLHDVAFDIVKCIYF